MRAGPGVPQERRPPSTRATNRRQPRSNSRTSRLLVRVRMESCREGREEIVRPVRRSEGAGCCRVRLGVSALSPMVDKAVAAVAKVSYDRCCKAPEFLRTFYRNFLAACPEAAPRFAKTDFEQQTKQLHHAIGL